MGTQRRIGGASLLIAGLLFFGTETLSWAWSQALGFVASGASVSMTLAGFPWQNAIASVLTIAGGALLLWPGKKRAKPVSRAEKLYGLYVRSDPIVDRVRYHRELQWFEQRNAESLIDIARDGLSMLISFEAEGLVIPKLKTDSAERVCVGLHTYFSTLGPLMRDGHVAQVDGLVATIAERADQEAQRFNPENWHVERY